jgi:hypothetical protein
VGEEHSSWGLGGGGGGGGHVKKRKTLFILYFGFL